VYPEVERIMPVLLVDDDVNIVSGLSQLLSLEDISASIATDVESAEAMVIGRFFPVILADIRLHSDEDGLRLIEKIRAISPRSKVAAMTGHATAALESRLQAIGASTLLRKPFESGLFLQTIRTLRTGDYDALYRESTPRLRAMMIRRYRMDADQCDDILQQAWCVLLEKRAEVRDIGPFLAGTVMNLSRQMIHRCVRERPAGSLLDEVGYVDDTSMTLAVRRALSRIDERSRALCELIGLQELSYAEAAQRLALPIGSVGPLYMRAKERLKKALAN
jgi:DNA-directed RNA polymerase specialized sigma24 family protein